MGSDLSQGRPSESAPLPRAVLAVAMICALAIAFPILSLLVGAPWGSLGEEIFSDATLTAARVSMIVSLAATGLSIGFGVPLAFALARARFWGKPLVRTIVTMPLVLPPVVTGVALLAGFGRRSPFGRLVGFGLANSMAGAIMAATVVALPFLVLSVEGALRNGNERHEQVAASLGAPPMARWWRISLPAARPAIIAGAILAWARALGEFGATITFAGNIDGVTRTLPLEIDSSLDVSPDRAVALSVLMMAVSLGVLITLRDRWMPNR